MARISVVFTRKRALGSLVLRTAMWSPWSHCGLVHGNWVIEATATQGVCRTRLDDMLYEASKSEIVELPCLDPEMAIAAAESQIGKKYDWGMVIGHAVRQDWDDLEKWACSELVAWAIAEGGTQLFRHKPHRITPQHLFLPLFSRSA